MHNYAITYSFVSPVKGYTRSTEFFRQKNGDQLSIASFLLFIGEKLGMPPTSFTIDNVIEVSDEDYDLYWKTVRSTTDTRNFDNTRDLIEENQKRELLRILELNSGTISLEKLGIKNYVIPVDTTRTFQEIEIIKITKISFCSKNNKIVFTGAYANMPTVQVKRSYDDICWPVDTIGALLGLISESDNNF